MWGEFQKCSKNDGIICERLFADVNLLRYNFDDKQMLGLEMARTNTHSYYGYLSSVYLSQGHLGCMGLLALFDESREKSELIKQGLTFKLTSN